MNVKAKTKGFPYVVYRYILCAPSLSRLSPKVVRFLLVSTFPVYVIKTSQREQRFREKNAMFYFYYIIALRVLDVENNATQLCAKLKDRLSRAEDDIDISPPKRNYFLTNQTIISLCVAALDFSVSACCLFGYFYLSKISVFSLEMYT